MVEKNVPVERDRLELEGLVINSSNSQFTIQVSESYTVLTTISGKMRQNGIKILVGDTVKIEVSPFDLSRGRIVRRLR
jgi:translation initiation factor IF-1